MHTVKETSTQAIQFHSRAFQLAKSRPLRSSATANTQCLRARVLVASSKHYWWTAKPRSPHRAPSKAVIRCRRLSPLDRLEHRNLGCDDGPRRRECEGAGGHTAAELGSRASDQF